MNKLATSKAQDVVEKLAFPSSSCVKRNFTYIKSPRVMTAFEKKRQVLGKRK
jgi:hypothetical protein